MDEKEIREIVDKIDNIDEIKDGWFHSLLSLGNPSEDWKLLIKLIKVKANQNNIKAQWALGIYYSKIDQKEAVEWFKKAAASPNNHSDSQHYLGTMYEKGLDKDEKKAIEFYRAAAIQDHYKACVALAMCYDMGIGVEKNEKAAEIWREKSRNIVKKIFPEGLDESLRLE